MTSMRGGEEAEGDGGGRFDRILVVEDDPFSSNLLLQLLMNQGYQRVEVAADGRQALDRLRRGRIDLVLLDIEMPQLDGLELLHRLKDDPRLSAMPVIVVSGVGEVASIVRCIDFGAEDYLSKPFNPVILRARISADRLLNVILPAAEARELKSSVAPRRHEQVAVLFCDIVGFTAYCDRATAGMLCFNPDPLRSAVRCEVDMIAATAEVVND